MTKNSKNHISETILYSPEEIKKAVKVVVETINLRYATWKASNKRDNPEIIETMDSHHTSVVEYVKSMLGL